MSNNTALVIISDDLLQDARNIARGVYAPLTGFLRRADFESVVEKMRLSSGELWPIPIVLDIDAKQSELIRSHRYILLSDAAKKTSVLLKDIEIYSYDKRALAQSVFGTQDSTHPGVAEVMRMKDYLVGGDVEVLKDEGSDFAGLALTPTETRQLFNKKGWRTIVAFQTRNVPHLGHEYLQKQALKEADGLLIHPVIGRKKDQDFKDEIMLAAYEVLIDKYYDRNRVVLGALPIKMRYAGPREALFHALIRRNYGCTHFIVGRDHAGVGNFYPPFAAQEIFDQFSDKEIGVKILKFPEVVYCPDCQDHRFIESCSHPDAVSFSGSQLRDYVSRRQQPPAYLIRPEVYYLLLQNANPLVNEMYRRESKQRGFVLWFTGLSQAGKTINADRIYQELKERGLKAERLDGDVVRESLTADLGFSKADRDENIRRVGQIAKLFSERSVIVIASFISPYRKERRDLRAKIRNFVEVFVNAPLAVCEARDTKGLYERARRGEIKNFTGVSDPYEAPENPEIEIRTDELSVEQSVQKIINYLEQDQLI